MNSIRRYEPPSSQQLLRHILERPELVAAVRELPGELLGGLIERVGLEDAGEIVALASAEQLAEVFDQDLWRAEAAGADEDFDLARFGLWLEVLSEAGDDFLAERLATMSRDLLLLVLHRTLLVLDLDAWAVKLAEMDADDAEWTEKALEDAGHCEEWEEFRLIVRVPEHWDVLWGGLLALDRDHHALLRDLFERCAALDTEFINGNGGLYEVLTSEELLASDIGAERQERRAAKGHVSPADARAFLALAKQGAADEQRDAITRAYFRGLPRVEDVRLVPERSERTSALGELTRIVADAQPVLADDIAPRLLPASRRRTGKRASPPDRRGSQRAASLFQRTLTELREVDPALASERLEEVAFLANVWMAGGAHDGRRPRPIEALELVVAVCDRALVQALAASPQESARSLLAITSADLLFRRGFAEHHLALAPRPRRSSGKRARPGPRS